MRPLAQLALAILAERASGQSLRFAFHLSCASFYNAIRCVVFKAASISKVSLETTFRGRTIGLSEVRNSRARCLSTEPVRC